LLPVRHHSANGEASPIPSIAWVDEQFLLEQLDGAREGVAHRTLGVGHQPVHVPHSCPRTRVSRRQLAGLFVHLKGVVVSLLLIKARTHIVIGYVYRADRDRPLKIFIRLRIHPEPQVKATEVRQASVIVWRQLNYFLEEWQCLIKSPLA